MTQELLPTAKADDIIRSLPAGSYNQYFQPQYRDTTLLRTVLATLQTMPGVTNLAQIESLKQQLAAIVTREDKRTIVIEGHCSEPIHTSVTVGHLAQDVQARLAAITASRLGDNVLHIQRRVQSIKPRSSEKELIDTLEVNTYMGDAVNGAHAAARTPDPQRLLALAIQAVALDQHLRGSKHGHTYAAHEALSLAYEQAMLRTDTTAGKRYLVSADMPWIGMRTNQADGLHADLLRAIANPVGVKVGDSSSPAHIRALTTTLNPAREPGKLLFMIRTTPNNRYGLDMVLRGIKQHAPESVLLYDIHGVTRVLDGRKVRIVTDIIDQIVHLSTAARRVGLRLHGVHLETMGDDAQLECLDDELQVPTRPGSVDPALNPAQLRTVLDAVAGCLQEEA